MGSYNTMVGIGVIFATKTTMRIKVFSARADAARAWHEPAAVNRA
jgi:hypothetical protein